MKKRVQTVFTMKACMAVASGKVLQALAVFGLGLILTACAGVSAGSQTPNEAAANVKGTVCKDPRPMVCTMEYRPVCATLGDGSTATYPSGCNACADVAVASWVENACDAADR